MTFTDILLRLGSVFLLIAINAFFVTAEFSIVSVRRSRINQLVATGDLQAQTVQSLQRSLDKLLSTTQLGITLSSLALGWIGEDTMASLVGQFFALWPLSPTLQHRFGHSLAIPLAFLLVAYLQIVLGELCPKAVALLYPERLARFFAPASMAIARIFNPFIWVLNQSTKCLLQLLGIPYTGTINGQTRVTSEELQLIINTDKESVGLEAEERELLNNVFEFGEVLAQEIMIPRINIHAIAVTADCAELMRLVAETNHACFPVTGESLDDIRGLVNFKDLALLLAQDKITPSSSIQEWMRPVRFVLETDFVSDLLPMMQRSPQEMVMVVDEFGGTAGLITLNDLIAEIIGDEHEGKEIEPVEFERVDEQTFIVQAQMNLEEFNEILGVNLPLTDEYQTLGGFLLYQWQKIPTVGESLAYHNLTLTVITVDGPRLNQVQVTRGEAIATPMLHPDDLEE